MLDEIKGAESALRIMVGTEIATRLVNEPIDRSFGFDFLAINANGVRRGVDANTMFADDTIIDANTPSGD